MDLQELRYFVSVAKHRHFTRAAQECHISQPNLSGRLRKLEDELGVQLFERSNKKVALTAAGARILLHARRVLDEAAQMQAAALSSRDPLVGPLKLGVIPTLAPYLMPLLLDPLRAACPQMRIELWEDLTSPLLDRLRDHALDAALIATPVDVKEFTSVPLFVEKFVVALPLNHKLAKMPSIIAEMLYDLLVLADGHCLSDQVVAACGQDSIARESFQAASLDTLVNLVAAGYGTTLVPGLAAGAMKGRSIVLRPLKPPASRTVRLASRPTFPRSQALQVIEGVIRRVVQKHERVLTMPQS